MQIEHSPHPNRAGLSLVELLVALALLSLIGAGLAGAFGVGVRVFDRAGQLGIHQDEIAARRQLRASLVQALPGSRITTFPNSFVGAPDDMQFTSLQSTPFAPDAAASRITLRWDGSTLSFDFEPMSDDGETLGRWSYAMSNDVGEVSFSYLDTSGDAPVWQSSWADRPDLPALVRITATGGAPEWVDFVVAPRL
ncbi:prepilin-type N-terminal cleavage/methylation domain-containing protein [uncultured Tateyamaria sp.]|uniref:prepilin-type N-terminal cleavage/methylation domain-containing protein n=1 Tax=Tateyamaria sp. 1078 TaxID=3417464 RepID=UPI00260EC23C|nr:prepilin-type N-terminal cleavage/methylation domain-containing protein [uncultured Tateyamaria sp.]